MTKEIEVSPNFIALVDDEDFELVCKYKWHNVGGYAQTTFRSEGGRQNWYMHRLILNFPESPIDHINNNPLDNRKQNLRVCTIRQNQQNQKLSERNKSGYRGVSYYKTRNKWRALISGSDGEVVFLGYFSNPEEAAKEYDKASMIYHGEFGKRNF